MKTISLNVSDKTAAVIEGMNEEELKKLKEKVELYVSNPVDELFAVMDEAAEYARQKGLSPEKLAELLEIDMDEMNRTLGREK
jgi:cell wall assembly regulator SMI1